MSTGKKYLTPFKVITDGDMSTASITSAVTEIPYLDNVCYQMVWTGTPTGNFDVQVSLDKTNWTSLVLSPPPVASGSAGSYVIDMNQLSMTYIRLVYTRTASTGVLNVYISAKGL